MQQRSYRERAYQQQGQTQNQTPSGNTEPDGVDNYDYNNSEWPRDFDIRIEVAEQKEVLERSNGKLKQIMHCSEYDF